MADKYSLPPLIGMIVTYLLKVVALNRQPLIELAAVVAGVRKC